MTVQTYPTAPGVATPKGHYSVAAQANGILAISGQLPIDQGGQSVNGPLPLQAAAVFANIDAILQHAGASRKDLFQVTVYISDIALWPEFNALYAEWLGDHRPARAVVPVTTLNHGASLEIAALAALP